MVRGEDRLDDLSVNLREHVVYLLDGLGGRVGRPRRLDGQAHDRVHRVTHWHLSGKQWRMKVTIQQTYTTAPHG